MADDLLGVPVKHDGQIQQAPGSQFDFGHINAPELIRPISVRFRTHGSASGFKAGLRGHDQVLSFHNPVDTFFINSYPLTVL